MSAPYAITDPRRFFAEPATPRQRQYEALRAFYLEGLTSTQAAERFGYSPGAFRVLIASSPAACAATTMHKRA
jgi:DNA-directed RNA polymerase specialized sigma24 family protein